MTTVVRLPQTVRIHKKTLAADMLRLLRDAVAQGDGMSQRCLEASLPMLDFFSDHCAVEMVNGWNDPRRPLYARAEEAGTCLETALLIGKLDAAH